MKKLLVSLILLLVVFALCANGETETVNESFDVASSTSTEDYSAMLKELGVALSNEDVQKELKKEGIDAIVSGDTITYKDEEGEVQISSSWPKNEFTALVPKPGFGSSMTSYTEGDTFTIAMYDATVDNFRDYAKKVKASGFNIDVEVEDSTVYGMTIYSFSGKNKKGYSVEVYFALGIGGIAISKE